MNDLSAELQKAGTDPRESVLCIIVGKKGSTPRKVGAKMIVFEDGSIRGTIGGGALEEHVIREAIEVIRNGESRTSRHDLLHQHGMCCGGTVDVYMEPVQKPLRLYIFGAGHTGKALAHLAVRSGFDVYLADNRFDYLHAVEEPGVNKMNIFYDHTLASLPSDERTYVCIMTHDHTSDREILFQFLKKKTAWLGMIGSRRKCEVTRKMFLEAGISEVQLNRVEMPVGISIGAEGPEEIAVSVIARLIEVKNKTKKWKKELR
ncbi:MAG: XdhC family protein [Bacteroidia bacterium]|nr:XdhC family protein [Bacteroidia bacterium]